MSRHSAFEMVDGLNRGGPSEGSLSFQRSSRCSEAKTERGEAAAGFCKGERLITRSRRLIAEDRALVFFVSTQIRVRRRNEPLSRLCQSKIPIRSYAQASADAAMAPLLGPADAERRSTCGARSRSKSGSPARLILKIGVYKGAPITVPLNDRLDYFGQTESPAARRRGLYQ